MEKLSIIIEQLADAILICDENSEIIFANTACALMFGYTQSDLIGMSLSLLMSKKHRNKHETTTKDFITKRAIALPMMGRQLKQCLNAEGNEFIARISVSSIEIDDKVYGFSVIQDYTSFNEELLSVEVMSKVDSLTNLYNRRYLENVLKSNNRIINTWKAIGVIFIDLDKFKPVNDTYGHHIGDFTLKKISNRIKERIRYNDIPIRLGGDEFLIFINLDSIGNHRDILSDLCTFIHEEITKPIKVENTTINMGASIGFGSYPEDANNLKKLIELTDKAMYKAKNSKKHIVSVGQLP